MNKNIISAIIIIILVGVAGYFALVRKPISSETPISPPTSKTSEFEGYTETEQQEQCNSYFGTFFDGKEIPSELAKKAVDAAKDFLKSEVGEEQFLKKHYRYECSPLRSIREHPGLILIPFKIKVINKGLDIDATTNIQVGVDKETLQIGAWDALLKKDALVSKKWLSRKDVLDAFRPQVSEEIRQKIDELKPDEISVTPSLSYYESDKSAGASPELKLYWTLNLEIGIPFPCQLYVLSALDGKIVYDQSQVCSK